MKPRQPISGTNQLFLREEELRLGIDLLYFASRDLAAEVEGLARRLSTAQSVISPSHLRLIGFLSSPTAQPATKILRLMRISKQSFSRMTATLVARGWVIQTSFNDDRRQRLLCLTEAGRDIERQVTAKLSAYLARAYRSAGASAVTGMREVLLGLINEAEAQRYLPASLHHRKTGSDPNSLS
ncbi:MAG: MarR family transcriptional regulator [Candidatus Pacebacteria bacterium]|nr:MarR family transcriptional regulator [Candidatus Paceibacterota bacterium]